MPAAVIGGVIAGAGAIGSAVIANKGASSAAKATQQAADQSAAVIRENYDKSAAALAPWQQSGLAANAMLNDFYGIPQAQPQPFAQQAPSPYAGSSYAGFKGAFGVQRPAQPNAMLPAAQPQVNSRDAFKRFIENSDYGFKFGEGSNDINSGYAGAGAIKSGAAMKALEGYRQNLQQGYRGEYLAGLGNQQQIGFGAASAQAGVSQAAGNSLASIYQNQGANAANAALLKAQNAGNALNSIAGIAGGIFGKKN